MSADARSAAAAAVATSPRSEARTARADAAALDAADPLASLRDSFALPEGIVYLDGNSLGALPRATAARVATTIEREWREGLIRSWNDAGWIGLAREIGDLVAPLIGARAGEVGVGDSTSVNLYKVLSVAAAMQQQGDAVARRTIVSERENFPTDLYIAESVAAQHDLALELAGSQGDLLARIREDAAIVMLTHVNYRSGRMHDLATLTAAAHDAGALVIWDLAHSAGAVPVDLHAADADFAVGCGYKYLNGGPGAPAFLWAHPRHIERMERDDLRQPLSGWLGHAAPFAFAPSYRPADGIGRFVCGTPPILALRALQCGLEVFAAAEALGGMAALRAKSIALCELFIARVESTCPDLRLASPRDSAARGSQVSFAHPDGYPVMQALIARGVIGDFRGGEPNLLRFGFTPLYTRFVDAWDGAAALAEVIASGEWQEPRHARRGMVT